MVGRRFGSGYRGGLDGTRFYRCNIFNWVSIRLLLQIPPHLFRQAKTVDTMLSGNTRRTFAIDREHRIPADVPLAAQLDVIIDLAEFVEPFGWLNTAIGGIP